ncbi:MAG TPA: methyltransferase domain-containing protein [Pyrinomonadaceae bacterium]|nr:methyltransferase domain-containing protein [Pyrinomonadaceae bacterium]
MATASALAHVEIHDTVIDIFRTLPKGTILDVPAGEGALAERLAELGFDVCCCDLYPKIFKLSDLDIREGDLDALLPYDDGTFGSIVCIEGLEHIENPANAIREFSRLLKPGGMLVISIPNILNVEERLKWLFSGYTSHFKPLSESVRAEISERYGGMEEIAVHANPIGYSELRYLLEMNGFRLERLFIDKPKRKSFRLFPMALLIRLISSTRSVEKRKERWADELNSREVLMGGNTLIFQAQKL